MSAVESLSEEKRQILKKAWEKCFYHLFEDTTLITHWQTTIPDLTSSSPAECSQEMLYELFDLAAFDDMDVTMLRFLRARKYNVEDAIKMLTDALLWRRSIDIRKIMNAGEEALSPRLVNAGMYFIWGQDNTGRPIIFLNVGNFLPTKNEKEMDEFKRYLVYQMETARFFIGQTGVMALADLSDFGRKNIDMEFSKVFAQMFQNYYPEILGRAVVIGSGLKMALFETVWNVAKFLLDPEVRKKISFHKSKELTQFIKPEFIPKSLGGVFDEQKIRATAPPGRPASAPADGGAGLKARQLEAMQAFRTADFGSSDREERKRTLRSLWLEMAASRPQNLYERLGLLKQGNVDWQTATRV